MPDWILFGPTPWLAAILVVAGLLVWRSEVRGRVDDIRLCAQRRRVYGQLYDFASERVKRRCR